MAMSAHHDKQPLSHWHLLRQMAMALREWTLTPLMIPPPAPILHSHSLPCRLTLAYPILADTMESPSKCTCQPKCEGEPNTNLSPNVSTLTTSTLGKRATTQAPAVHYQCGELRTQQPGEGIQLGQGSVGLLS